jgi:hypothetical protein
VIATTNYYRDYIAAEGLDFTPVRPDFETFWRGLARI